MSLANVFMTTVNENSPLDASSGTDPNTRISEFLTIQSFTNFAAMSGGITTVWRGMQVLWPRCESIVVPFLMAGIWSIISILLSVNIVLKKNAGKWDKWGKLGQLFLIALINAFVLASAVIGTNTVVSPVVSPAVDAVAKLMKP